MLKIFLTVLFLLNTKYLFSEQITNNSLNDIKRLSNDLKDLQKYVYTNIPNSQSLETNNNNLPTTDKISDLEKTLKNLNLRLESLEIKIDDLYSLYLNKNELTPSTIINLDEITLNEDSSSLVTTIKKNVLGEIDIKNLEKEEAKSILEAEKLLSDLNYEIDQNEENYKNNQLNEDDVNKLSRQIDVKIELKQAKEYMTRLDNDNAILSLKNIIQSDSDDFQIVSEAYYLLGRTYFLKSNFNESVKFFGIRHRDFIAIEENKAENYFWLIRSLIKIGDNENACLAMEDIIFSDNYTDSIAIIEEVKSLQNEQGCGLIID